MQDDAARYDNECFLLRNEIALYQESGGSATNNNESLALRAECEQLRQEVTRQQAVLNEYMLKQNTHIEELSQDQQLMTAKLEAERARLAEKTEECDVYRAENEEMLVHFGMIKQQIDDAEEFIKALQEENNLLRAKYEADSDDNVSSKYIRNENTSMERQNSALRAQVRSLTEDRDLLARRIDAMFSVDGDPTENQDASYSQEQMVAKNHDLENRIKELETRCDDLSADLDMARSQLDSTEAALKAKEQLQLFHAAIDDLDVGTHHAPDQISKTVKESEEHVRKLEAELGEKKKIVVQLNDEVAYLKGQLVEAEASNGAEEDAARKDAKILALEKHVEELQTKLSATEDNLHRIMSTQEGAAAAEHLEAIESLRSHFVSLAISLERSEDNRADTLTRLVSERETHARTLKSMSENVKRFYSMLSFEDD